MSFELRHYFVVAFSKPPGKTLTVSEAEALLFSDVVWRHFQESEELVLGCVSNVGGCVSQYVDPGGHAEILS